MTEPKTKVPNSRRNLDIAKDESWDALYAAQAEGLDVLGTADEAVAWVNALVARISSFAQEDA